MTLWGVAAGFVASVCALVSWAARALLTPAPSRTPGAGLSISLHARRVVAMAVLGGWGAITLITALVAPLLALTVGSTAVAVTLVVACHGTDGSTGDTNRSRALRIATWVLSAAGLLMVLVSLSLVLPGWWGTWSSLLFLWCLIPWVAVAWVGRMWRANDRVSEGASARALIAASTFVAIALSASANIPMRLVIWSRGAAMDADARRFIDSNRSKMLDYSRDPTSLAGYPVQGAATTTCSAGAGVEYGTSIDGSTYLTYCDAG